MDTGVGISDGGIGEFGDMGGINVINVEGNASGAWVAINAIIDCDCAVGDNVDTQVKLLISWPHQ